MTKNKLFAWAITLLCFSLPSCSDEKDGPSEKILVTNAGVTEANQTVKPGDIVHIYGDGFQEGDQAVSYTHLDVYKRQAPECIILDASLSEHRKQLFEEECKQSGLRFISLSEKGSVRFLLRSKSTRLNSSHSAKSRMPSSA